MSSVSASPEPTGPVPTSPVPTSLVPDSPVPTNPVPDSPVPTNPVPDSPVPTNPVPDSRVPTNPVPDSPVPTNPVTAGPVAEPRLSHLDAEGRAQMVDVTAKPATVRYARAAGRIRMQPGTLAQIMAGSMPKGDVLAVARVAAVQGAKLTPQLIPLCHGLPLSGLDVEFRPLAPGSDGRSGIEVTAEARTVAATGVEMEAMTAVAVALLTLYDMAKGVDRAMEMEGLRLLEKRGGRSGVWQRDTP